ncbi:MAG: M20 family metallopeptidase [bacterium]|nr:M20 family metallopeptidase [bacterium]
MISEAEILKKLISFKTITGNKRETARAFGWIDFQLRGLPVFIKKYNSAGFGSLIITTQKTDKPIVWLASHLDVVSATEKDFKPTVKNNILYGRGAYDMKFALACYLKLLKELGGNLKKYNFGVMITSDEEVGGGNGVKFLLESGFSSKLAFLPDGGSNWQIEKGAKGVLHYSVESIGKSAHASRAWQGINAINQLIEFLLLLQKEFPKEPCKDKDHFHTTLNIGKIEGGKTPNQVPDFAKASIDIRFPLHLDKKIIHGFIKSSQAKFKGIKIKEDIFAGPLKVDLQNKYLKTFCEILKKERSEDVSFIFSHGTSDGRYFAQRKIPVILTRPKGGGLHSEGEWVDLQDLKIFYLVLKKFVEQTTSLHRYIAAR